MCFGAVLSQLLTQEVTLKDALHHKGKTNFVWGTGQFFTFYMMSNFLLTNYKSEQNVTSIFESFLNILSFIVTTNQNYSLKQLLFTRTKIINRSVAVLVSDWLCAPFYQLQLHWVYYISIFLHQTIDFG